MNGLGNSLSELHGYWEWLQKRYERSLPFYPLVSTNFFSLVPGVGTPAAKEINGAKAGYADYDPSVEQLVMMLDTTIWGSAKQGLTITDRGVYAGSKNLRYSCKFDDILDVSRSSDNVLVINGTRIVLEFKPEGIAILADFIARLCGLSYDSDGRALIASIVPSWYLEKARADDEAVLDVFTFHISKVHESRQEFYVDRGLVFTDRRVVSYFFKRQSAPIIGTFDRANFNALKFVAYEGHEKHHSHTPHMAVDSFKHPTNFNLAMLAISAVTDVVNFIKGLDPKAVFEIWIGKQASKTALSSEDTLIFSNVSPEAAISIADCAQNAGMKLMRPNS